MSYSKVTINIPKQAVQLDSYEGIRPDTVVHFLPMDGMHQKDMVSNSSLAIYKEKLAPYNLQMMEWLQNTDHAIAFYNDPLAAFREAVNAPDDLIEMLKQVQMRPPQALKGTKEDEVISQLHQTISDDFAAQLNDLTEGWDIVIGMRQDAVNKVLQYAYEKDLFPHDLDGEYESPLKGYDKIKVNASLLAPSMSSGTGSDITVALTIQTGVLEITGNTPIKANIDGLTAKLTLNLSKIKSPIQPEEGVRYDFMLDIADDEAFVGFQLENVPATLALFKLLAEMAILEILKSAFSGREYRLFSIDVNGAGKYKFIIPQEVDYAGQSSTDHLPAIGALVTTSGGHKGVVQLNANLFPADQPGKSVSNAVMVMSRDLFLSNVGTSSLASAFKIDIENFSYNAAEHYVYNTKEFNYIEKVKGYTVRIKEVRLKIENSELALELVARVEPSSGIYIDYTVYAPYTVSIKNENDKQTIHFEQDKERYRESHEVSAEWWVWLLAFLALIIGTVVLAIILAVIDAMAPDIGVGMFSNAIEDVKWNYIKIARLNSIELGDCIRIGCEAEFTPN